MWTVLIAVVVWSSIGLFIALLYRRRGHNLLFYGALGIWLGPLVMLVMWSARRQQQTGVVRVLREGRPSSGWIDVLVGVDGSIESVESVRSVIAILGRSIRRIRVVSVLDAETAKSPTFFRNDDELEHRLRDAASRIGFPDAELALAGGRADRELVRHANEAGFDVLVVAHRAHRLGAALFGSTVERLARTSTIPLIIGPQFDITNEPSSVEAEQLSQHVEHVSNKPIHLRPPTAATKGASHVVYR